MASGSDPYRQAAEPSPPAVPPRQRQVSRWRRWRHKLFCPDGMYPVGFLRDGEHATRLVCVCATCKMYLIQGWEDGQVTYTTEVV